MPRGMLVSCETTNELARVSLNSRDKHNARDQYRNGWTPPHGRYSNLFSDLLQADAGFPDPLYGGPGLWSGSEVSYGMELMQCEGSLARQGPDKPLQLIFGAA